MKPFVSPKPSRKRLYLGWLLLLLVLLTFLGVVLTPGNLVGMPAAPEDVWMLKARNIYLALFQYAADHDRNYPEGRSSTEVFQKLLDGNYVCDPTLFYLPLVGKTRAVAGRPLRPENVAFDTTAFVDTNSPDSLPLVFTTGYRVAYRGGGAAVPRYPLRLSSPQPRTWEEWWAERTGPAPRAIPPGPGGLL